MKVDDELLGIFAGCASIIKAVGEEEVMSFLGDDEEEEDADDL